MAGTDLRDRPAPPAPLGPARRWRDAAQPLLLGGAIAVGCAYVAIQNPNESSAYPQCPFKAMTGLDCPGCGMTRAVYALLHGDLLRAASHNLLLVVALPLLAYLVGRWTLSSIGVTLRPAPTWRPWMTWSMLIFVLAFAVVRNVPGTPLSWLDSAA
ncbi:DUF2752 domain-containing protein [Rhabdothermincola sediminis]|uniref:DUF2752 domain-containing protein n=1 Tax=Rhabdothermincola sediminis TaxID=2751370 RepID=UPI0027DA0CC9|nr:DUF2752 domain-containing protein [Rhabdothermincola sediminis]